MHDFIAITALVVLTLVILLNVLGMIAWVTYQVLASRFLHIQHPVKKEKPYRPPFQPDLFPETLQPAAEVRHPSSNFPVWP